MVMNRREFLTAAGAVAAGGVLAACGNAKETAKTTATTAAAAQTGPSLARKPIRKVKLGFIALTDASSIIMAKELGYFTERDLDVDVVKQASWPATRDA